MGSGWDAARVGRARARFGAARKGPRSRDLADGSLQGGGPKADGDTYTVVARTSLAGIRAIRLEALPDPSLPDDGTGRGGGNFVLSRFGRRGRLRRVGQTPVGRFVRVELPGKEKMLSLAEVQVFSGGANVAREGDGPAVEHRLRRPARAGHRRQYRWRLFGAKSTTHTRAEDNPWWEVELAEPAASSGSASGTAPTRGVENRLAGFRVRCSTTTQGRLADRLAEPPKPQRELSTAGRAAGVCPVPADFAQTGFDVAGIIDPKAHGEDGLGGSPRQKERTRPSSCSSQPLPSPRPRLTFRLEHRSKTPGANLGRFRLRRTSDPRAARCAEVPAEVLAVLDMPAAERTAEQPRGAGRPLSLDRAGAEAAPRRDRRRWRSRGRRSRTCR